LVEISKPTRIKTSPLDIDRDSCLWEMIVERLDGASFGTDKAGLVFDLIARFVQMCETCRDYMEFKFLGRDAYIRAWGQGNFKALMLEMNGYDFGGEEKCPFCSQRTDPDIFGRFPAERGIDIEEMEDDELIDRQRELFSLERLHEAGYYL